MATYNIDELWCIYVMVKERAIRRVPQMYLTSEDALMAARYIVQQRDMDERVFAIAKCGQKEIYGGEGLEGMTYA